MEIVLISLIIGIIAGILSGMFGIGGGVVIVPALVLIAGFSIIEANGTSLAALLLPVGIFACIQYYRTGLLNIKISATIAFGLLCGVYFGAELAIYLDNQLLKQMYGIFLLYISWLFIKPFELLKIRKPKPYSDEVPTDGKLIYLWLFGIFTGILSGLFGIGGGLIITPFLIAVFKFNTKKAIGTSLGALLMPVGLPGVLVYLNSGNLSLNYAVFVAIGLLVGAFIGAKITISMESSYVKRIYGLFLVIISIDFLFRPIITYLFN